MSKPRPAYEYTALQFYVPQYQSDLEQLNALAAEGWRVVTTLEFNQGSDSTGFTRMSYLLLEREVMEVALL